MKKVIGVSNYDDETISDILWKDNLPDRLAERIVMLLNDFYPEDDLYIYKAVPQNHVLHEWKP